MKKMSFVKCLVAALVAGLLTGCASVSGQPRPVVTNSAADEVLKAYSIKTVLNEYGRRSGRAQRAYRDDFVAAYLQIIDSRYFEFRGNLTSQEKGTQLGFDSLLVGLAGAATLSPNAASDIAAVTQGVLGLRSSIDKNVYFDRTLPALLAAMDTERLRVRASIVNHQTQDTADYPLTAALGELQDYQQAGSLGQAVATVTDQAAIARKEAKDQYETRVRFVCDPSDETSVAATPVGDFFTTLYDTAEREEARGVTTSVNRMAVVASMMGVNPAGKRRGQLEAAIGDAFLGGFCKVGEIDELKKRLLQANVGFTG